MRSPPGRARTCVVNKTQAASRLRQRLRMLLEELTHNTAVVQGRDPLVAGSLYERRRRCGKTRCLCAGGQLHGSLALSISRRGRSQLIPLAGLNRARLAAASSADRSVRQARQSLQRLCRALLQEAGRLHQARRIDPRSLRQTALDGPEAMPPL